MTDTYSGRYGGDLVVVSVTDSTAVIWPATGSDPLATVTLTAAVAPHRKGWILPTGSGPLLIATCGTCS